jgi:hypothetical protein
MYSVQYCCSVLLTVSKKVGAFFKFLHIILYRIWVPLMQPIKYFVFLLHIIKLFMFKMITEL